MSDKMTCPGCDSRSSSVLHGFEQEGRCPFCGLSREAAFEIIGVKSSRADEKLKARVTELIGENEKLRVRIGKLERFVGDVQDGLDWLEKPGPTE